MPTSSRSSSTARCRRASSSRSATTTTSTSSCRSGPPPDPRADGRTRPSARLSISLLDLRGYASLDATFGPGPHLVWGPNAAGKTSLLEAMVLLAWGRVAPDDDRRRADPLGDRPRPGRGLVGRRHPRGRDRPGRRDRDGRPQADPGQRPRPPGGRPGRPPAGRRSSRPRRCSSIAGSPSLRRAVLDQLAVDRLAGLRRRPQRPTAGRSSSATACCARSARRARRATSCASGTAPSSTPAGRSSPSAGGCSSVLAGPLAAAHAEIAPDEAAAARLTLRYVTNAPPLPGESPRDALARRLVETAEKEVWNGSTLVGPHRDDLVFELGGRDLAGVRVARPAADRDPGPQAGRARRR